MQEMLRKMLLDALEHCDLAIFHDDGSDAVPGLTACADENEYASRVTEVGLELVLRRRLTLHRAEIETALERLQAGGYGICEECGGKIGLARLKANPTTRLCIRCQAANERSLPRCA